MFKGLLEVSGTIDLNQFWPAGESDADTVKVLLSGPNAFKFRSAPSAAPRVTHAFDGAVVKGKLSKPAIDKNGRVTIRLQGIDAPELHYRPVAPTINKIKPTPKQRAAFKEANGNFRQEFGETATIELKNHLGTAGNSPIQCVIRTAVDHPDDVFDTFGRLIGDVIVTVHGKELNANLWLCEHGWAFPTFYSSMSRQEIEHLTALSEKAHKAHAGIWRFASADLTEFDHSMVFRNHGAPDPAADAGHVILPKLFRRRSTFGVASAAKMVSGNFKQYLQTEPDKCFETHDFLAAGPTAAKKRHLDEFVSEGSKFTVAAKDLVFDELPSKVVGADGKPAHW